VVDVAMAQLAASLSGMDNECDVGEFQALEGRSDDRSTHREWLEWLDRSQS
jgi:hypothetical protein